MLRFLYRIVDPISRSFFVVFLSFVMFLSYVSSISSSSFSISSNYSLHLLPGSSPRPFQNIVLYWYPFFAFSFAFFVKVCYFPCPKPVLYFYQFIFSVIFWLTCIFVSFSFSISDIFLLRFLILAFYFIADVLNFSRLYLIVLAKLFFLCFCNIPRQNFFCCDSKDLFNLPACIFYRIW